MALYVGPDQIMPVASILATVVGALLIFWNKLVSMVFRIFGVSRKQEQLETPSADASVPGSENPQKK